MGTATSGSIRSRSARCGLAGLRPTFGRLSRYGVMALSWTQDRLGPICRYAEDCAIVMQAIAKPDGRDMSVTEVPLTAEVMSTTCAEGRHGYHQLRRKSTSGGATAAHCRGDGGPAGWP
jgi:Asp-tRNA(Asn)/Glu-tRNA(Gln) amidotransferase A subunit family amidase